MRLLLVEDDPVLSRTMAQGLENAGHRVELACPDPDEADMLRRMDEVKWKMLEDWSLTKRAPKHAAFFHEREFKPAAEATR
jgi:DNA-binding response OmpR family regulator